MFPRDRRRGKGLHILKFVVLGLVFITVVGFVTMTLWNCLIPELFHGPVITFWQGLGLLLLGKLLFGWHNGGGPKKRWKENLRERMNNMSDEEKERMRELMRNRCRTGFKSWRDRWDAEETDNKSTDQGKEQTSI